MVPMLTRDSLPELVAKIQNVPTLPEAVGKICRIVNDPASTARQLRDLVKTDVAMAMKMLRMVNSVFYGVQEPIHDLEQALVILGFNTVRSVALSVSVINMFQQSKAGFDMRDYWTHAAVSAAICRLIAERTGACDPELAFIIGLLKDIGKLVLAEHAPDETRAIMAVGREFSLPFHKAAVEVIMASDAEVGAWLCRQWGLDEIIVDTVLNQNDLAQAANPKLVAMCQLVEYLCRMKNLRVPGNFDAMTLDDAVWTHLGLDKEALIGILGSVDVEAEKARDLLEIRD